MGTAPADDAVWARLMNATLGGGDPYLNPEGPEAIMARDMPEVFERCQKLIEERRANPTDDLTTVLARRPSAARSRR
jgi:cytochrome P450